MSEIGEAVGTIAEGGLYSRAVEKSDGEGSIGAPALNKGHFSEKTCLNCATPLQGPHCHHCGQKAHLHRTIRAFMHDLLHGALHFEGKMWSTLPKLILKPGELTRRYVAGERAKFVSPMALFLFSVFLMFAIFQAVGLTAPADIPDPTASARTQAIEMRADLQQQYDALDETQIEQRTETADALATIDAALEAMDSGGDYRFTDKDGQNVSMSLNATGIDWIDRGIIKKWRQNPGLMLYKLQANSYKFSWLLIPLSVPFMCLLFVWKRRFRAYDHAIFVTYSLAFMSMLFIALSIMGVMNAHTALIATAALLIPPIHIYKQLRGAYGLSRFSTIWRLAFLLVFILIVLVLFLQLLLLIGAF